MVTWDDIWNGLPDWMNNQYMQFLLVLLFWVLVALVVVLVMRVVLRRVFARTKTRVDDALVSILDTPIILLIIIYGTVQSLGVLEMLPYWLWDWVLSVYAFVLSAVAVYLAYKVYREIFIPLGKDAARKREAGLEKTLMPFVDSIGAAAIILFGGLWLLSYNGVNITVFLAGAGIAGLVLAFALQDTLSNYFSGLYLMMDRPFKEGDIIVVNEDYCEVKAVGFRSTRLYNTFKHDLMIMPNNMLANQLIINKTEPNIQLRIDVSVGVAYGSHVEKVKEIMTEAVTREPGTITDDPEKKISLRFRNFGDSALEFRIVFFIDNYDDQWRITSNVREHIDRRFREEGITIPFPQRTLSFLEGKDAGKWKDVVGGTSPATA